MAIEINNVSKQFGSTCALSQVSLILKEPGLYGLLGNNGAGKSTLFNIITNRLYPDSGNVTVDGNPVFDNDPTLKKIFMMGEESYYPEDMKVSKAFTVTKMFYPTFDDAYANELAVKFALDTHKKISKLSTGYASIFKLIIALAVNTPYLLLDEPVLGLDAQHRDMFYKLLIEKYSQNPCTIVLSTHLIQEVANIIEHTIIIRDGVIIKDAGSEELLMDCATVSGPAAAVDAFVQGMLIISQSNLGGLKSVCVEGLPKDKEVPAGLEFGKPNLQDYFIGLMNKGDMIK